MSSLNASANIQENKQIPFFESSNVSPSSSYTGTVSPDNGYEGFKNANIKIWNPFISIGYWGGREMSSLTPTNFYNAENAFSSQNFYIGKCLIPSIAYLQKSITDVSITNNNNEIIHTINFNRVINSNLYIDYITFGNIMLSYTNNVVFVVYFFSWMTDFKVYDSYGISEVRHEYKDIGRIETVEWSSKRDKKLNLILNYGSLSYSEFKNKAGTF